MAEHDLIVIGSSPCGITCALRAAREGLSVLLVSEGRHIGGMLASGIGVMDTQYDGRRAPLYDEICDRIKGYYRERYGADSVQYRTCLPGDRTSSGNRLTFEPHAAEAVLEQLIAEQPGITVLRGWVVDGVERGVDQVAAVHLRRESGEQRQRIAAALFVDATYTGDLAAQAGVPYRVGREDRHEFGEPHAGRIFSVRVNNDGVATYPRAAVEGLLNLRPFQSVSAQIFAGSTGEGDHKVQSYHLRLCMSRDPANQRKPRRPAGYDRDYFLRRFRGRWPRIGGNPIPNAKANWWTNYIGEGWAYPDADWSQRRAIIDRYRDYHLGLIWFLQNDAEVPEEVRAAASQWGLAADEFVDNDHVPYELYVREARRIQGRAVFTEHAGSLARGIERAPMHADAVAMTEWFMDSHEVSEDTRPGSAGDGLILLSEITRPGQVPFRCLLDRKLVNLLVPLCVSATHVGWGTIRLESVFMQLGEAAGFACALAKETHTAPGHLDADLLVRRLVAAPMMVSFFNDFDAATVAPWVAAVQYLGTRGFFADYDARPDDPLSVAVAEVWARAYGELVAGPPRGADADRAALATARAVHRASAAERRSAPGASGVGRGEAPIDRARFGALLTTAARYWGAEVSDPQLATAGSLARDANAEDAGSLPRGEACRMVFAALDRSSASVSDSSSESARSPGIRQ